MSAQSRVAVVLLVLRLSAFVGMLAWTLDVFLFPLRDLDAKLSL